MLLPHPSQTRCRSLLARLAGVVIVSTSTVAVAAEPQQSDVPTPQVRKMDYGDDQMIEESNMRMFPKVIDGSFQLSELGGAINLDRECQRWAGAQRTSRRRGLANDRIARGRQPACVGLEVVGVQLGCRRHLFPSPLF